MCTSASSVGRGALIVLEGCDRTGKSTQCKELVATLLSKGIPAKAMHFPDRTTPITGSQIDRYLTNKVNMSDRTIHLLFSANRWELESNIREQLQSGVTLVIDRYAYSGVAFTAAKKVASIEWCKGPDRDLPLPDAVFYLHLSPEEAIERKGYGEERYEKIAFQKEVSQVYDQLEESNWLKVDASQPIDIIHKYILNQSLTIIEEVRDKTIHTLWPITKQ